MEGKKGKPILRPYQNWHFFNKNGELLNLRWDEKSDCWKGGIYLPEVSVGLIENEHIFVTEKFLADNERDYNFPSSETGLEKGFGKFIFTLNLNFDLQNPQGTVKLVLCNALPIEVERSDFNSDNTFLDEILRKIQSFTGFENSFRNANQFTVIFNLDTAFCVPEDFTYSVI
jgi:hypothetical protein